MLYAADVRGASARGLLAEAVSEGEQPRDYTVTLVEGVVARQDEIDALLTRYSDGWSVDRMPAVDRNLLRIAVFEVLSGQVDAPVAVSEAVGLASELSTDESPAFVNGLLGKLTDNEPAFAEAIAIEPAADAFLDEDEVEDDLEAGFTVSEAVIEIDEDPRAGHDVVADDADEFGDHFKAPVAVEPEAESQSQG